MGRPSSDEQKKMEVSIVIIGFTARPHRELIVLISRCSRNSKKHILKWISAMLRLEEWAETVSPAFLNNDSMLEN